MIRYILIAFGIYILYRLIFDIIIPVFRASRRIRQQMHSVREQMQQHANQAGQPFNRPQPQSTNPQPRSAEPKGDYIEFEEIKP